MTERSSESPLDVAVLIPALNEEDALPAVLREIPPGVRVVVADNGSTDGTARVATSLGAEVVREDERGYGAACLAGIRHLRLHGPTPAVLVFLDGDGSDDPSRILQLAAPVLAGEADMVLGVRRSDRGDVGTILPHARFGNRLVLTLVRMVFGRTFRDMPPFRAIGFPALVELEMDDRNWGWTLQMQVRAHMSGLTILEVDAPHRHRAAGESKISGRLVMSVRVGLKMFFTLARERLRRR